MKRLILLFLTGFVYHLGSLVSAAAEVPNTPVVKIELNQEPSFKDGVPQTVRTKLTELVLDGDRTDIYLFDRAGKYVGVEVSIGKSNAVPATDSARLKVELLMRDGTKRRAPFRPSVGAGNGSGVFEVHVAKFGSDTKLRDIQEVLVTVDRRAQRFAIAKKEKSP